MIWLLTIAASTKHPIKINKQINKNSVNSLIARNFVSHKKFTGIHRTVYQTPSYHFWDMQSPIRSMSQVVIHHAENHLSLKLQFQGMRSWSKNWNKQQIMDPHQRPLICTYYPFLLQLMVPVQIYPNVFQWLSYWWVLKFLSYESKPFNYITFTKSSQFYSPFLCRRGWIRAAMAHLCSCGLPEASTLAWNSCVRRERWG